MTLSYSHGDIQGLQELRCDTLFVPIAFDTVGTWKVELLHCSTSTPFKNLAPVASQGKQNRYISLDYCENSLRVAIFRVS